MKIRMKTLIGGAAIGVIAFIVTMVLQRTAYGALQIWEIILPLILLCGAGVLLRNYLSKKQEGLQYRPDEHVNDQRGPIPQYESSLQREATVAPEGHDDQLEKPLEEQAEQKSDGATAIPHDTEDPPAEVERTSAEQDLIEKPSIQPNQDGLKLRLTEQKTLYEQKITGLETLNAEQQNSVQELRKEKEFILLCMNNIPMFFAVLDSTGKTLMMNRHMSETLGYSEDQIMNVDFVSTFIPQKARQDVWSNLVDSTTKNRDQIRMDSLVSTKDGREIPVECIISRFFDSADRLSNCVVVGVDITERKTNQEKLRSDELVLKTLYEKANEDVEYYRSVLDSSPDAMVIYDVDLKPKYTNPAFKETFGWTVEELRNNHAAFVPDSQGKLERAAMDVVSKNSVPVRDFASKRRSKDGHEIPVTLTVSPIRNRKGDSEGMLLVLREAPTENKVEITGKSETSRVQKRQIKIKEVVNDIKSGATNSQIMEKYKLSATHLQNVFQKLLNAKMLTSQEIYDREVANNAAAAAGSGRSLPVDTIQTLDAATSGDMARDNGEEKKEAQVVDRSIASAGSEPIFKLSAVPSVVRDEEQSKEPASPDLQDEAAKTKVAVNDLIDLPAAHNQNTLLHEAPAAVDATEDSLVTKRMIRAKEIAKDVHAGMGDTPLMEKYSISTKQLNDLLRKLLDANLITDMQLYERTSLSDSQVTKAFVETGKAIKELG